MLLAIETNPIVQKFVLIALAIVIVGLILRVFKQPDIIIYIITGVIIGPYVLGLIDNDELIVNLGNLGLILLLFFIGMEISLPKLFLNWKVSLVGTLVQILFSILVIWMIGSFYDWSYTRIITLGFVISISSTAVLIKYLEDANEIDTFVGQIVIGILLVQDVLIVPMIIVLGYFSGTNPAFSEVLLQTVGGILIIGFLYFLYKKGELKFPFHRIIKKNHDMQVFLAFGLCFGFASITAFSGLSAALGAFVAGIFVGSSKTTKWFHDSLYSLKVIFVALFFVSIGMLIDIPFLYENIFLILILVLAVLVTNSLINTLTLRIFRIPVKESIYAGSLLSPIGEFSFVLGSVAYYNGIINDFGYQIVVAVIALSLLFSTFWIKITKRLHKSFRKRILAR
jgi:CPA2 family monovalent cation:H+ antiporter-2